MAWPKGKPNPKAFGKKKDDETPHMMSTEEMEEYRSKIAEKVNRPTLPISEKLSDVIAELKSVLTSYRHDIEIKVKEQSNVTTEISVLITFLTR